ncbi:MAG: hypothetical protein ACODAJ_12830, partial [Planctomycetota bacterium]
GLFLMLLAAALAAPPVAVARSARRGQHRCPKCRDTSRVPCPHHDRRSRAYKPYCSAYPAEPPCCKGVGWIPCARCADEVTKTTFQAVRALYAKERRGEGFYPWGDGFFLAACEHYRFKAAASHAECHEFHAVAEAALDLFERIFGREGVEALQWDEKGHFLILSSQDQYHKFLAWYQTTRGVDEQRVAFLKEGMGGARFIADRLQVIVRAESATAAEQGKEVLLHRIAHGAGHLAIENYKVFGNTPLWLDEGWACRSEIEALDKPMIYCVDYVGGGLQKRKPQEWKLIVRDAIRKRKLPTFERLFAYENAGEMGSVEWAMSCSLVDWLVTKFPRKTRRLVDALKDGTGSKEAWEAVFEANLARIERVWRRWARVQH